MGVGGFTEFSRRISFCPSTLSIVALLPHPVRDCFNSTNHFKPMMSMSFNSHPPSCTRPNSFALHANFCSFPFPRLIFASKISYSHHGIESTPPQLHNAVPLAWNEADRPYLMMSDLGRKSGRCARPGTDEHLRLLHRPVNGACRPISFTSW